MCKVVLNSSVTKNSFMGFLLKVLMACEMFWVQAVARPVLASGSGGVRGARPHVETNWRCFRPKANFP